jgi:cytoskeleton protein RodZ
MDLTKVGEILRARREEQGLSLDEVMERTKISRRNLMAIEAGDEKELPHPVYAKGFIRIYAELLDLDPNEITSSVRLPGPDIQTEQVLEETAAEPSIRIRKPEERSGSRIGTFVLVVLLIGLLAGAVWYMTQGRPELPPLSEQELLQDALEGQTPQTVQQPTIEEPPVSAPPDGEIEEIPQAPPPAGPADVDEPAPEISDLVEPEAPEAAGEFETQGPLDSVEPLDEPVVAEVEPAPEPEPEPAPEPEPEPAPEPEPEPAPESDLPAEFAPEVEEGEQVAIDPAQVERALRPGENVLAIFAKEECWVGALVDDEESQRSYYVYEGETQRITFSERVSLVLGNPTGVVMLLNGDSFNFPYEPGKVARFSIPPE